MIQRFFLICLFFSTCTVLYAFIPPVASLIKDSFEGRRPTAGRELVIRHQFVNKGAEIIELEERLVVDRTKVTVSWKGSALLQPFWGNLERRNYGFGSSKLASRSSLFLKYLIDSSADDFAGALLSEQFIRRDQLNQFKTGFELTGEPQTWPIKDNYIQHEGIYLKRVKNGSGYAVTGLSDSSNQRLVVFDKGIQGIRRFEWKDGGDVTAWNFDQFVRFTSTGLYPRRFSFEKNGVEVIVSELLVHRPIKEKQIAEFRSSLQRSGNPSLPSNVEEALRLLLSYR